MFGGLDLHGRDVGITWTKLGEIASVGDDVIVLAEAVAWSAGDEIVIGPSRYNPWETETFMITSVSGDGLSLTLNESLKYDHLGMFLKLFNVFVYLVRMHIFLRTQL